MCMYNESMVQLALFEEDRPTRSGPVQIEYTRSQAILNKGVGMLQGLDFTLNPYVGCQFGCSYCYAANFQVDERKETWGTWVRVKENAVGLIKRARNLGGKQVMIGSATDPYQPIEAQLLLTRSILEALAVIRPQPRVSLVTRSPLAERDIDVFQKFDSFRISISITTDDDEIRKAFEPGCPSIQRRMQALEAIVKAGVDGHANLAPLLPMRDPLGHLRKLNQMGVRKVWINTFLKGSGPFSSSTKDAAFQIAEDMGWTEKRSERMAEFLKSEWKRLAASNEEPEPSSN